MIGRLLRASILLVVCFCVGTVVAAAGLGAYLAVHWEIDRSKLVQMLAVAQGIDLLALKEAHLPPPEKAEPEQPSFEQILEARALKSRDLELREQALRNSVDQFRFDLVKLDQQRKEYQRTRESFQESLVALNKQATDSGWDEVRRTLVSIKPKQAKELLLQMMEKNEMPDVVSLLGPMPDTKRAKIFGEFKTPEETRKIEEVLRLLRKGEPTSSVAAETQRQLAPGSTGQGVPR